MGLFYCMGRIEGAKGAFNDSIKLNASSRSQAMSLARQTLADRWGGARVKITSAVEIGRGAGPVHQGPTGGSR